MRTRERQRRADNGIPLCSFHHHLVHDKGWRIDWNKYTGHVAFHGPRGQTLDTETHFHHLAA